jgi:hypothetical protein
LLRPWPLVALLVQIPIAAAAQTSNGGIEGLVSDTSGARVADVRVTATATATGLVRYTVSGPHGAYRLHELPPGHYTVRFERAGFTPVERSAVVLAIGSEIVLPVQLEIGALTDAVQVSSNHSLVETSQKSIAMSITAREVDALPLLGRRFVDLAALAPGVTRDHASATSGTDSIAFGGLSENYKSLWFEGIDIGDEATGGGTNLSDASRLIVPQEAVQEFQVMGSQYSVEFGRSATGVINVLGKSGTNAWLGRGYYFFRGDEFDRPNAFASAESQYDQQLFGGSAGGPIVENKVHAFVAYDGQLLNNLVTFRIPEFVRPILPAFDLVTEAPQPYRRHTFYGKVTWGMSPSHYLSVSSIGGRARQELAGTGGAVAADAGYTNSAKDLFLAAALTSAPSTNWTHVLRFAWSNVVIDRPPSGARGPSVTFPSFTFGQRNNYPELREQQNYIVMSAATYHRETRRLGVHDLKFGGSANFAIGKHREERAFNGSYVFLRDAIPVAGDPSTYPTMFSIRTGSGAIEDRGVDVYALYVEDKIALRRELTVTAGLRYDPQVWRGDLGGTAIPDDVPIETFWRRFVTGDLRGTNYRAAPAPLDLIAPRVGLAWDPANDGRTVVRAGWGVFNAFITTRFLSSAIGTYPDFLSSAFGNDVRVTGVPNLAFPDLMPTELWSRAGSSSVSVPVPDAQAGFPSTRQFTVGVERQVGASTTVATAYTRLDARHLQRTYNVNARLPAGDYPISPGGEIMNVLAWDATARSHQFHVQVTRRLRDALSFDASYTWMRASALDAPVNAHDPNGSDNWGPTINDIHHRLVGNVVYRLPLGIDLGAIAVLTSAPPYNIVTGTDDNGDRNANDRPIVNGVMLRPNAGRGDGYFTTDLRIGKLMAFGSRRVEVMVEMFNLFNTDNYAGYIGNRSSASFGQPTIALAPFQGQVGARFFF